MLSVRALNVLIVEDDPDLRALYRAALQLDGFAVIAVEDGVDALRHLEGHLPAAVILDLDLPRLGGRDVQREFRARVDTRDIPIVVVTGSDASDLNPAEFACILRKPLDPQTIVTAVRKCLGRTPV